MGNHTESAFLNPGAYCWNAMRVAWRNQQIYSTGEGMDMVHKGRPLRDLFSLSNQQFLCIHTWCFRKVLVLNQQLLQSLHRLHSPLCYLCVHVPKGGTSKSFWSIIPREYFLVFNLKFQGNTWMNLCHKWKFIQKKRDDWVSLSDSEIFKSKIYHDSISGSIYKNIHNADISYHAQRTMYV